MVAFICVIVWIIVTPCIAVICGLPFKKEKGQHISWKRYSTCMLLVSIFTFFLLYMYDEHYELLYKFFLAIGVIGAVVYALGVAFRENCKSK